MEAEAEAKVKAAATFPSQVRILAAIKKKVPTPSAPGPSVPVPSAPPASNKKKRKRKNKPASSAASKPLPTPTTRPPQQPPVQQHRPLPGFHLPDVDHRLAPLSIPGRASALGVQQQQRHPQPPPPPAIRGSATAIRPSTPKLSRREEQKGLPWKLRRSALDRRRVDKTAVNAAAGWVDPRWALMSAAAAASTPRLPLMVPLPPYPARHTTAPIRPTRSITPV